MEYETFLNEVKEHMEHALGKGYDLTLRRVPKNNGLMLDGLCIAKDGGHVDVYKRQPFSLMAIT